MKPQRLEQYGVVRFLGALAIFAFHYYQIIGHNEASNVAFLGGFCEVAIYGSYAVELFFMLSGFFMSYAYDSKITDLSFGNYMLNRIKGLWLPTAVSCIPGYFSFKGRYNWGGYTHFFKTCPVQIQIGSHKMLCPIMELHGI